MEICKTDTVRLLRLLKEAALIIEDNCRGIRSLDKARQLRQMARKFNGKNNSEPVQTESGLGFG